MSIDPPASGSGHVSLSDTPNTDNVVNTSLNKTLLKGTNLQFPTIANKLDRWRDIVLSTLEAFELESYALTLPMVQPMPEEVDAMVSYLAWRKKD